MSRSIAEKVKANHGNRRIDYNENSNQKRLVVAPMKPKYDVNIKFPIPNDYPERKFLIQSLHGILFSNPNNFNKGGKGKNARYAAIIKGGSYYFTNNIFHLFNEYSEYDWNNVLATYPKNVASYKDVEKLLIETKKHKERSIFEFGGKLYICGIQPNDDNVIGKVFNLYEFDFVEFAESKSLLAATKVAAPKTMNILDGEELLGADDGQYLLKLEIISVRKSLELSQKLNNILSVKVSSATRDALNTLDARIGRSVNDNGHRKGIDTEVSITRAVVTGPDGLMQTMADLSELQWSVDEDTENLKTQSITYTNDKYRSVFGAKNAIRELKSGEYFIKDIKFTISQKKKDNQIVQTPNIKIKIKGEVNGRLQLASGAWQWLRTGQ